MRRVPSLGSLDRVQAWTSWSQRTSSAQCGVCDPDSPGRDSQGPYLFFGREESQDGACFALVPLEGSVC